MKRPLVKRWTEADNELLKKLAAEGVSLTLAAAALKRRVPGVQAQAKKLGLRFPTLRDQRREQDQFGLKAKK